MVGLILSAQYRLTCYLIGGGIQNVPGVVKVKRKLSQSLIVQNATYYFTCNQIPRKSRSSTSDYQKSIGLLASPWMSTTTVIHCKKVQTWLGLYFIIQLNLFVGLYRDAWPGKWKKTIFHLRFINRFGRTSFHQSIWTGHFGGRILRRYLGIHVVYKQGRKGSFV